MKKERKTYFSDFSEEDLLATYEEYRDLTFTEAAPDADGKGSLLIDTINQQQDSRRVLATALELLEEISQRWAAEKALVRTILQQGDPIWYTDIDNGTVEHGVVEYPHYQNGQLLSFSVTFDDGDFDEFFGETLGRAFFRSESEAKIALNQK